MRLAVYLNVRPLVFAALLLPSFGYAQGDADLSPAANIVMPRCGPSMDGQVFCKFGTVYECQLFSPNSLERHTGWRWTADILRSCGSQATSGANQRDDDVIFDAPEPGSQPGAGQRARPAAPPGWGQRGPGGTMYIRP